MACILNTGYTIGCRDNTGGVQTLAIGPWELGTTYSYSIDGEILTTSYATASFYEFEQYTEQASATGEVTANNEFGTIFNTQTLTFIMEKMDAPTRAKFLILTQGRFRVLIKTQNGEWLLMGRLNGARLSAGTNGPGKAFGDMAGFTGTLTAVEPEPVHIIDETEALRLIA
jgi:hypothetical protein